MTLYIENTLTKQKEPFPSPEEQKEIKMYSCGVTVYDACHIGHARSLYVFDVIRRYLTYRGYNVHFVRNITDIDDKIIHKAKELGKSAREVSRENIALYKEDLARLGIAEADQEPKATENIDEIVKAIQTLLDKGKAYEVEGNVYFSVREFKGYGKLSGQSIEHMEEAVRIEQDEFKKDPLDFALWKKSKEGEPAWPSPWGEGRPGWHIECTCMSMKYLKTETLDIHAGGRDLVFPHHENEIAQSEILTGKPFSKFWIHHGLLTINGRKMAKSLGNFVTIQDCLEKYSADQLKMLFLASHYGSPVDYSDAKMEEAYKALQRFDILFWKAYELMRGQEFQATNAEFAAVKKAEIETAMDDDFNTARVLGALFELVNETNKFIDKNKDDTQYLGKIQCAVNTMEFFLKDIFGLYADDQEKGLNIEQEKLLDERIEARAQKDFKRSDEIRDALSAQGIVVEDGKSGQTWRWA